MDSEKITHAIKRLAFADLAFIQAHALCNQLIELNLPNDDDRYAAMFAGICVTYAKPFMSSEGLGPLPALFLKFSNLPAYQRTHDDLVEGRNRIYAHRDLLTGHELISISATVDDIATVKIEIRPDGFTAYASEPQWPCERLKEVIELISLQRARLKNDIGEKVVYLMSGEKKYRAGEYILGKDFP
jgi:hypothetical protein